MNLRLIVLVIASTFLAVACDVGVPSKEEVAKLEKTPSSPTTETPPPAQVNTLPPGHPPTEGMAAPMGGGEAMPSQMGATQGMPHPQVGTGGTASSVEPGSIPVAEGGMTIEDLYAHRTELTGKTVKVRGKVVKATPGVMGANWYHIQDGTGAPGANDLAVTTDGTAKVGDVVVIAGTLATDKDFGMGYTYDAIVEKATLTNE